MQETWLRGNARAALLLLVVPLVGLIAGLVLIVVVSSAWARAGGVVLCLVSLGVAGLACWLTLAARLKRDHNDLLVRMAPGRPIRVPLEFIEVFFSGAGPTLLPTSKPTDETANLVVRIADRATDFAHVEVPPLLGRWCGGYITIRGTWCEPLTAQRISELNARLVQAHAEIQAVSKR